MSLTLQPYDRAGAVAYAHHWAYGRNPRFYDYERLGGDCTNFASQCLYAGGGVMNFVRDFGWYYVDPNQKAPAWTGVEYLFQFLTREQPSAGPAAVEGGPEDMMPGDIIQLSFDGQRFAHSPVVVVGTERPDRTLQLLVAAHSHDCDNRPLHTYPFQKARYLHITGIYRP